MTERTPGDSTPDDRNAKDKIPYLGGETRFFPDPHLRLIKDIVRAYPDDDRGAAGRVGIGLVGIPFDRGVTSHRQGARLAPHSVREALFDCSTYNLDLDVDIGHLTIADCGNVETVVDDFEETHRRVEEALTPLFGAFGCLLIIGGDHSLSAPSIRALARSMPGKKIGIVDFDTHFDVRSGWEGNSGMWAREVQEIPGSPVSGRNIAQIGVHGFDYSEYYRDVVREMGLAVFRPRDVRRRGMEDVMAEALERAADGVDALYVTVDIDVLDPPFAPGTNKPAHGGLMGWELVEGVVMAGGHPLMRGLDLMEIAPPLDEQSITVDMGAEVLAQFLGACALRAAGSSEAPGKKGGE